MKSGLTLVPVPGIKPHGDEARGTRLGGLHGDPARVLVRVAHALGRPTPQGTAVNVGRPMSCVQEYFEVIKPHTVG